MSDDPFFRGDKFQRLLRKCVVFPADGSETRIVYMVVRTVTVNDISPLSSYSRCVDVASTFGDDYRKTKVMSNKNAWDGVESNYIFFYNLSLNLPINLNVAHLLGVTPSHLKARKRLFWRGDIVAMKVQLDSESSFIVKECLNANRLDLNSLEQFLLEKYRNGNLESDLYALEQEWDFYVSHLSKPSSLLFGPSTFWWGSNAAEKEENFLNDLNELRYSVGRPPLPRHVYMKSYFELASTIYASLKSALRLDQKVIGPPKLPPDLERRIFEMCAFESPETCTVLVLVAWRVHDWIDPILITTVCIIESSDSSQRDRLKLFFAKLTNGKPAEYYGQHIKHLCILATSDYTEVNTILATCTGVENLALWAPYVDLFRNPHSGRNLRRLCINLGQCSFAPRQKPNFYHACFANLTHLHLYDEDDDWVTYLGWENLSSLTHLAFACASSPEKTTSLIKRLPAVRYVALGHYRWDESRKYSDATINKSPHIREAWGVWIVFLSEIPAHDWERGARGEGDFWDLVEEEVDRRLEGIESMKQP